MPRFACSEIYRKPVRQVSQVPCVEPKLVSGTIPRVYSSFTWTCIAERPLNVQAKHCDPRQRRRCKRAVQVSATVAEVATEVQQVSQDGYEVSQETLSNSRRRITVTAPSKLCQKAWKRMIKQARKEVKAPGFRDMKSVRPFVLRPPHADQFALTFQSSCWHCMSTVYFLCFRFLRQLCYHIWGVTWALRQQQ